MKQNNQENNNIIFGIWKARGIPTWGFGRVLARKAKTGEKFWSAGSTSLTPRNNRAENADQGAVGVPHDCCQGTRGEGDDGDDDTCLCHGLSFDFEDKFHVKSQSQDGRKKEKGSKKSVGYSARVRGRQQGQCRRRYSGDGISMVLGEGRKPDGERSEL